jgi:hypothetical protein
VAAKSAEAQETAPWRALMPFSYSDITQIFFTNLSCLVEPTRLSRLWATRVAAALQKLEAMARSTFSVLPAFRPGALGSGRSHAPPHLDKSDGYTQIKDIRAKVGVVLVLDTELPTLVSELGGF